MHRITKKQSLLLCAITFDNELLLLVMFEIMLVQCVFISRL